jgi:hypothetical protein
MKTRESSKRGCEVLAIFRRRFPSRGDAIPVFAACVVPVFTWSILQFLYFLPSWLLSMSLGDVLSILAYTLASALLESVSLLLVMILLAAILPARFFRNKFAVLGSVIILLTSACAIVLQYNLSILESPRALVVMLALYLASIAVSYVLVHRFKRVEGLALSFAERLTILLYVYVPLGLIGALVVLLRNL